MKPLPRYCSTAAFLLALASPAAAWAQGAPPAKPKGGGDGWSFGLDGGGKVDGSGANANGGANATPPPPPPTAATAPPPAAAPAPAGDEEDKTSDAYWNRRHLDSYTMPTISGATGLLRVASAQSGPVGTFRVQVLWDYFNTSGFLCTTGTPCSGRTALSNPTNDSANHFGATFAANATVLPFLETYVAIRSFANSNDQSDPQLLQVLGDTTVGVKGFTPAKKGRLFSFAGDAQLLLLNGSGEVGLDSGSTSFNLRGMMTADFRGEDVGALPLLAHLNVGYRFDNSGTIVEGIEGRQNAPVTRVERYGLGINRVDLARVGLGVEGVFEPNETFRSVRPFLEYTMDIPVNRQGYTCRISTVSAGDECLGNASGFSSSPSRLSMGMRANAGLRGLMATVGFDIGLSGTSTFLEEVAPQAPWTLWWGLGYAFDTQVRPPRVEMREAATPAPAPVAKLKLAQGFVHQAGSQTPINGAIVRLAGGDQPGFVTNSAGQFLTGNLADGQYTFDVKADGFKPGSCSVTVGAGPQPNPTAPPAGDGAPGPNGGKGGNGAPPPAAPMNDASGNTLVPVDCALEALPKRGAVTGKVIDAKSGKPVAGATIVLKDSKGASHRVNVDAQGGFKVADLPPGKANLSIGAEGYLGASKSADVAPKNDANVSVSLHKRPKHPRVVLGKRSLILRRKIHFSRDSSQIQADSDLLLQEIADILKRNQQITLIEVQGHTDNTGSQRHNQKLSNQRAESVRKRLESLGIKASRLQSKGYGSSSPIVPNVTAANRARNRRVAFIIRKKTR